MRRQSLQTREGSAGKAALPYAGWIIQSGFDHLCCTPEGDDASFRESRYPYLDPTRVAEELEIHLRLEFPGATVQIDHSADAGPLVRNAAIDPDGVEDFYEVSIQLESELDLFWTIRFPELQAEFGEAPISLDAIFGDRGVAA